MSELKVQIIGIGAIKAGTSFLAKMLSQHPEIRWARRKEINYFNTLQPDGSLNAYADKGLDFYHSFFKDQSGTLAEFSPSYLADGDAPQKIYEYNPDARLIAVLRDPVERAYSHYLYAIHFLRSIPKDMSFRAAVREFPYLLEQGNYGRHLSRYQEFWADDQLAVIDFEDLVKNPVEVYDRLVSFLGLSPAKPEDTSPENQKKKVRYPVLSKGIDILSEAKQSLEKSRYKPLVDRFLDSPIYMNLLDLKNKMVHYNSTSIDTDPIISDDRKSLEEYYADDWRKAQQLINL